jgi:hypothetical protein
MIGPHLQTYIFAAFATLEPPPQEWLQQSLKIIRIAWRRLL